MRECETEKGKGGKDGGKNDTHAFVTPLSLKENSYPGERHNAEKNQRQKRDKKEKPV